MIKGVLDLARKIDRLLPALLFAALLSLQSLVSSGAADYISFPELVGPDGRILTFADICNTAGDDNSHTKHCASCLSTCFAAPETTATHTTAFGNHSTVPGAHQASYIKRHEATQSLRRAPPTFLTS